MAGGKYPTANYEPQMPLVAFESAPTSKVDSHYTLFCTVHLGKKVQVVSSLHQQQTKFTLHTEQCLFIIDIFVIFLFVLLHKINPILNLIQYGRTSTHEDMRPGSELNPISKYLSISLYRYIVLCNENPYQYCILAHKYEK